MSAEQFAEQGDAQEMWFTRHFLEVFNNMGLQHGSKSRWLSLLAVQGEDQVRSRHCEYFRVTSRSGILVRKSRKSHKAIKNSLG